MILAGGRETSGSNANGGPGVVYDHRIVYPMLYIHGMYFCIRLTQAEGEVATKAWSVK